MIRIDSNTFFLHLFSLYFIHLFIHSFIYFQAYYIIWILCKYSAQPESEIVPCKEPASANLTKILHDLHKEIIYRHRMGTSTFHIIPEYRNQRADLYSKLNNMSSSKRQTIYGNSRCRELKKDSELKLTCPWYVYLEYDENRIPQIMAKAECTCRECIKVAGYCEKVYTYVNVIRRYCTSAEYDYKLAMEPVPVGCTCKHEI